jgi:hypothetical protein
MAPRGLLGVDLAESVDAHFGFTNIPSVDAGLMAASSINSINIKRQYLSLVGYQLNVKMLKEDSRNIREMASSPSRMGV